MHKNNNIMKNFISKYNALNEQSAVLSDDFKERIVQYLEDNDDLLEKLASLIKDLEPEELVEFEDLGINKAEFGIREGDEIYVKRLSSTDAPKFSIWVNNKEQAMSDIDLENAAFLINRAASGMGTDEEAIAAVAGGLIKIASDKNIDPNDIFNKLKDVYENKYGESLKDAIEGEFTGRAEVAFLNAFRLKIEDSVARGLNIATILGDIGLTIISFGAGTAAAASIKGGVAGARALKYAKAASNVNKLSKLGKLASPLLKLQQAWSGMSKTMKIARLNRLAKSGKALQYTGKGGTQAVPKVIHSIKNGQIFWKGSRGGAIKGPLVDNVVSHGGLTLKGSSLAALLPGSAKTIAAGASIGGRLDTAGSNTNFAEIMGWYDTLTGDPTSYIDSIKEEGATGLAETLLKLQDGTGIFGNTTDQEELQIALILTSINSETAKQVEVEFQRKGEGTILGLIDDELGGDLAIITKAVWAGLIGAEGSSAVKYASKMLKEKEAK